MTDTPAAAGGIRHFLDLDRLDRTTLRHILDRAAAMKGARGADWPTGRRDDAAPLDGHVLLMVFQKASTRTRLSFEAAMRQLGGVASDLEGDRLQLGRGESIADTARVLSLFGDAILLRTSRHENLLEMAAHARAPVINALTDRSHPCQIVADLLTLEESFGDLDGLPLAWLGDGNNVAASLIHAAALTGLDLRLACPPDRQPEAALLDGARAAGARLTVTEDVAAAVSDAAAVYTDTWHSMGADPVEGGLFEPYRVDADVMAQARDEALFLHCLPAHRGQEVTDAVMDGAQSAVWRQAENRLHAQKAILTWCLTGI